MNQPKNQKPNGFIIVASQYYEYYEAAHMLIDSLLDFMPDANIALFTHKEWTDNDSRCSKLFIVHDVLNHVRAKLWSLSKTPFNKTIYLDADTCVMHEDVSKMFDFDSDLIFTNIRPYAGKIAKFIGGEMVLHGGVFGYQSTPKVLKFMDRWWELYYRQRKGDWWPGAEPKDRLIGWDQFTLWWLIENEYSDLDISIYKDDARFNFVHLYKKDECEGEIVIWHYTLPLKDPRDARSITQE